MSNKLMLRFVINLENHRLDKIFRPVGALFNKWLPTGREDSININLEHNDNSMEIWFERKGIVDGGFIKYDQNRQEVDTSIMERQGKLDSGPLYGKATFVNITDSELIALKNNETESEEFKTVGKRINDFLYKPISNFIKTLRIQYGQYWIPELEKWDSRNSSLSYFLSRKYRLEWSSDNSDSWNKFRLPKNEIAVTFRARALPGKGYQEYLTKEDWERLKSSFDPNKTISLASFALSYANELYEDGHLKQSFVEATTSLELALGEFMRQKQDKSSIIYEKSKSFYDLPLATRFSITATIHNKISKDIMEKVIKAINIRNDIVHEGKFPESGNEQYLRSLFESIKSFIGEDMHKLPVLVAGNSLEAQN